MEARNYAKSIRMQGHSIIDQRLLELEDILEDDLFEVYNMFKREGSNFKLTPSPEEETNEVRKRGTNKVRKLCTEHCH